MAEPLAPLLRRRALVGGTQETTTGTFVAPTVPLASTAVYDAKMNLEDIYSGGIRAPLGNYLARVKAAPGSWPATLAFRNEITPTDKTIALMTGAGFKGVGTAIDPALPTSSMADRKTWSFRQWEDGRIKEMYGAAADFTITLEAGKPASIEWTWSGIWRVLATDAALPAQSPLSTLPYIVKALTFTIGAVVPPRVNKATIKIGNTVMRLPSITAADGFAYAVVTERAPQLTIDIEARKKADLDTYGLITTATEVAFQAILTSGANTLTIDAPKVQRIAVSDGDREGIRLDELTFDLNASAGDDELKFTEV